MEYYFNFLFRFQLLPRYQLENELLPNYWIMLPRELAILILSELELLDLIIARRVCKSFEHIISRCAIPLRLSLPPGATDRTLRFLSLVFPSWKEIRVPSAGFKFTAGMHVTNALTHLLFISLHIVILSFCLCKMDVLCSFFLCMCVFLGFFFLYFIN